MDEYIQEYLDKDGVPTSRMTLAQEYWLTGMSLTERAGVMSRAPVSGSTAGERHNALMRFIVANLLDYDLSDELVLSATPKAAASARAGMEKSFSATWDTAFVDAGTRKVGEAAFSSDAGYNKHDLEGISALAVGETWRSDDWGNSHTVTRLPDIESTTADRAESAPDVANVISETNTRSSAPRPRQ
jgi:hypothetical protein